ncbi:hydantoinase/oxoprolinase family protein [Rhodococcus sp. T2V]|uniref:hydantoinase/oxoprolinase family protein n=1 Tax=Rhodococcus sp. T2V TaxID=3034164 RepID=UPI0023E09907|nr:hydantoinase/oxoprolinase family protein [Rhodococcus sp. T2V]MDF3305293.1 hydantoinase/oxoprolinase family protein [Rhodococcus sp. T2V]
MTYAIGVDIGGTFSDCVAVSEDGRVFHGKALSTHSTSPVEGVLNGLGQLAEATGQTVEQLLAATDQFSHGTTIGTNLVVERKGARVGLVATKGHSDALVMMRGRGRTAGAPADRVLNVRDTDKPAPLVPRRNVIEVAERVAPDGSILAPLDEESARASLTELLRSDVEAISIALLWSFRNPAHERRLRDMVHEICPEMYVSISSDIAPRQGEFERTVASVINSYVGPASSRYLGELADALKGRGLNRPPFIMQSNGGVLPVDVARRRPVQTIGSGPAGGLAGTAAIAKSSGHRNVIATDMGGTSFEVGLLIDGNPVLSSENVIEQYTFKISQLDVRSIACGGGSIARVDRHSGALQVGPESAGSDPGPACYGSGTAPTVTDADVVLGLIDPDNFLAGRMELDQQASIDAVQLLAKESGLSVEEAASGILRVNGTNAATLIRQRTIEQGLDPRDFVVYAFGGAGPVHAFSFARELGVREVLIPLGNGASTLSAYGIAVSDATHVLEQECTIRVPFDAPALAVVTESVEARALAEMAEAGFEAGQVRLERTALARYAEQFMQELPLPMGSGPVDEAMCAELTSAFTSEYARLYGEAALSPFHAPEIFAVRVTATVGLGAAPGCATGTGSPDPVRTREVFWPGAERWITTAVYDGQPRGDAKIEGPAVVQLAHTTISVAPDQFLHTDASGNCVLTVNKDAC